MFRYFVFMILPFSSSSFCKTDQEYLKDLPPMTEENIRWMIPVEGWSQAHLFKLKKFLQTRHIEKVNFYSSPDFTQSPAYTYERNKTFKGKDLSCVQKVMSFEKSKERANYKCGYRYCTPIKPRDGFYAYIDLMQWGVIYVDEKDSTKRCDLPLYETNIVSIREHIGGEFLPIQNSFIPVDTINREKGFAIAKWKGKDLYIKLSDYQDYQIFDLPFNYWEQQWIQLKKHQEKKDLPGLNYLIENLLPCVKKRDIPCVKNHFLSKEYGLGMEESWFATDLSRGKDGDKPQKITDEILQELEVCLSYDRLMPHLKSLRGNKMACFQYLDFTTETKKKENWWEWKMDHVTFPEAVRWYPTSKILWLRK